MHEYRNVITSLSVYSGSHKYSFFPELVYFQNLHFTSNSIKSMCRYINIQY